MNIRPAISDDIPRLIDLDHDYSTDHVWQMGYQTERDAVSITFREVRLPRPMRVQYPRNPGRLMDHWIHMQALLVAEHEGDLLGYGCMIDGPAPRSGWVTDLLVDFPHRRQGIGTRLLGAIKKWCLENERDHLILEMQSKNFPAISLARKLGFHFTGYSDRYYPDQEIVLFFHLSLK